MITALTADVGTNLHVSGFPNYTGVGPELQCGRTTHPLKR